MLVPFKQCPEHLMSVKVVFFIEMMPESLDIQAESLEDVWHPLNVVLVIVRAPDCVFLIKLEPDERVIPVKVHPWIVKISLKSLLTDTKIPLNPLRFSCVLNMQSMISREVNDSVNDIIKPSPPVPDNACFLNVQPSILTDLQGPNVCIAPP